MWVSFALGMGLVAIVARKSSEQAQQVLTYALAIFFLAVLARLVIAIVTQPGRRRCAYCALTVAIALWAMASATLNASTQVDLTKFPSPGEWLFLASYVGTAAFLILDAASRSEDIDAATWLETVVICGGTACLAGAVLLTPIASSFGRDGLAAARRPDLPADRHHSVGPHRRPDGAARPRRLASHRSVCSPA